MEEELRALLAEDETLLWSGRPEPFETMDKTNKRSIEIGLGVKACIAMILLAFYIRETRRIAEAIMPGIVIFIAALAVFALLYPFRTARRLRNKTLYGMTDKRILRVGASVGHVPYGRIERAALRTDEDGHVTLLCGPQTQNLRPSQWRNAADVAFINNADESEAASVILYALPVDDELRALLHKYLPI